MLIWTYAILQFNFDIYIERIASIMQDNFNNYSHLVSLRIGLFSLGETQQALHSDYTIMELEVLKRFREDENPALG